jgi:acetyltransferase-like isoleucine patch superfamily enzyme
MSFRHRVKTSGNPAAVLICRTVRAARRFQLPLLRPVHLPLYHLRSLALLAYNEAVRVAWWTPLFQARLVRPAPGLHVFSGVPQVIGPLEIEFGRDCSISGLTTLLGRTASAGQPRLTVGDNSHIGWQTTIAVGSKVVLGKNVLIAGRGFLAGYPGHPVDPARRAAHEPDTNDQVGDIILEDDVWLATGVTVMAGVTIGAGSIVTAGSVVFRNIPRGVIVTGNPARVVGPVMIP